MQVYSSSEQNKSETKLKKGEYPKDGQPHETLAPTSLDSFKVELSEKEEHIIGYQLNLPHLT